MYVCQHHVYTSVRLCRRDVLTHPGHICFSRTASSDIKIVDINNSNILHVTILFWYFVNSNCYVYIRGICYMLKKYIPIYIPVHVNFLSFIFETKIQGGLSGRSSPSSAMSSTSSIEPFTEYKVRVPRYGNNYET
jgi:hypothetical protein